MEKYNCSKGNLKKVNNVKKVFNVGWRTDPETMTVRNAVLATLTQSNHFYMVRSCDSKTIGFPGGKIDDDDTTIMEAALREFNEETRNMHIKLSMSGSNGLFINSVFIYRGHTAIIFCKIPRSVRLAIDDTVLPKFTIDSNGEVCKRFLIRPSILYDLSLPPSQRSLDSKEKLRKPAICSTRELLETLGMT